MKLSSAWWLLSTVVLGGIVALSATGCPGPGPDPVADAGPDVEQPPADAGPDVIVCKDKGDWLGQECVTDKDCPTLPANCTGTPICVTDDKTDPVFQGGPSKGYCTMSCQAAGDCLSPANSCYKLTENAKEGRCLLGCEIGVTPLMSLDEPLDSFTCQGREDVSCYPLSMIESACVPTCLNDGECPQGRFCNLSTGVCVDQVTPPLENKLGIECKTDAECGNGFCIGGLPGGLKFCTGYCTLGGDLSVAQDCGGIDNGICYYSILDTAGAGDIGLCVGDCKTHEDCAAPGLWCDTIQGAPTGYCLVAKECPNGQMDCVVMGQTIGTCTDTTVGKWCLDTKYPLGKFTPIPDGGTDGGDPDGGTDGGDPDGGMMMMDAGSDAPADAPAD